MTPSPEYMPRRASNLVTTLSRWGRALSSTKSDDMAKPASSHFSPHAGLYSFSSEAFQDFLHAKQ